MGPLPRESAFCDIAIRALGIETEGGVSSASGEVHGVGAAPPVPSSTTIGHTNDSGIRC